MFRDGAARVLVFRLGDERFAVDLASVDEVIDAPSTQPLPDAPPNVLGITTVRGALATVYDPRPALDIVHSAERRVALVFARDEKRVLLAVDDVDDALTVDESEVRSAPAIGGADAMLVGLIRRGDGLIALVDAAVLLDAVTTAGAAKGERT